MNPLKGSFTPDALRCGVCGALQCRATTHCQPTLSVDIFDVRQQTDGWKYVPRMLRELANIVSRQCPPLKLDGCIVWIECPQYTIRSKRLAQAVYFLHSTMPRVTCLRLSDVSVICRVTYLQFLIQAVFSSTSVSQPAQRRTWFSQYRTSEEDENLGRFIVRYNYCGVMAAYKIVRR